MSAFEIVGQLVVTLLAIFGAAAVGYLAVKGINR